MVEDIFYYTHNKFGVQRKIDRHQIKFYELTYTVYYHLSIIILFFVICELLFMLILGLLLREECLF